jgi:hypothetical protein
MILRDWLCTPCTLVFEGWDEPGIACPQCGGTDVKAVIRHAPAVQTSGTRQFIDSQAKALAADFGLTDMSNTHTGSIKGDEKRRRANVVDSGAVPAHLQHIVDSKMDLMRARYMPPAPRAPEVAGTGPATPVRAAGAADLAKGDASVAGVSRGFAKVRPGPGTLRHPEDSR